MTQTLLISCLYVGIFVFAQRLLTNWIAKLAESKQVSFKRTKMVTQYITYLLFIVIGCLWVISLGIEYQQVSLFISSVFAVLGVALVAQWSILSNITAGVLIFFVFPYRIGDRIKIIDKDEDVSGIIAEISLFHVLIERSDGITITYPNNLMLQKGVLKLPQAKTQAQNKPLSESPEKDHTQVQSD